MPSNANHREEITMLRVRRILLLLLLAAVPVSRAPAQDEDPSFQGRKLSEWIVQLRAEKAAKERQVALFMLGTIGSHPAAWPTDEKPQRAALIVLEIIGPKTRAVAPALIQATREDWNDRIRARAAEVLGRVVAKAVSMKLANTEFRTNEPQEALMNALRSDPSGRVREAAASALGKFDPSEMRKAVPVLAGALREVRPEVQNAAAETLRRLGKYAEDAVPEMIEVLGNPAAPDLAREHAALALGRIGGTSDGLKAIPVLKKLAADPGTPLSVRKASVESLGEFGKDAADAVPVIGALLGTKETPSDLREKAAAALDQFGSEARPILPVLLKAVKDENKVVRCLVIHTLGVLGKEAGSDIKPIVTALLPALDDNALDVRVAAIETFGVIGPSALGSESLAVIKRLEVLTQNSQREVREAAENAIKKLKEGS
jgi:HEAT repeat protein